MIFCPNGLAFTDFSKLVIRLTSISWLLSFLLFQQQKNLDVAINFAISYIKTYVLQKIFICTIIM